MSEISEMIETKGMEWLRACMRLGDGVQPFLWQQRLLRELAEGRDIRALDIPTGLGKTAVIAIWLVARACGVRLPTRLIYVVDRRAVVDQATEVANAVREVVDKTPELKVKLGLGERSLPISTLRGQFVDNREWLDDPSIPAIVVGTVDMVGSRLLFEGYGITRKMRPYHAGLIGVDALIVLDEAHLVPPFEKLVEGIVSERETLGPQEKYRSFVPMLRLLCLSATGRSAASTAFSLDYDEEQKDKVVAKRLTAKKSLQFRRLVDEEKLVDVLVGEARRIVSDHAASVRVIVFCNSRETAVAARATFEKIARAEAKKNVETLLPALELLVGGRRVYERTVAQQALEKLGFIAGKPTSSKSAVLFATSAGEVGIDLDADHMVCDLVAWERMVQRLGRVNRRGDGDARVVVLVDHRPDKKMDEAIKKDPKKRSDSQSQLVARFELNRACESAIRLLPKDNQETHDASPGAIRALKCEATDPNVDTERRTQIARTMIAATTPAPLYPAVTRALVDAWAMTSVKEHTGRPEITPWLRGWIDDEPQTSVCWRRFLPITTNKKITLKPKAVAAFFEAATPHFIEQLETETYLVLDWIIKRAEKLLKKQPELKLTIVAFSLGNDGTVCDHWTVDQLRTAEKDTLRRALKQCSLVVDASFGGLDAAGMLDEDCDDVPATADVELAMQELAHFRVQLYEDCARRIVEPPWRERLRVARTKSEDGVTDSFVIDKWRGDSATEEDRSASVLQGLDEHQNWAAREARHLLGRLGLPLELVEVIARATRLHDEGKRALRWQEAFSAPLDGGPFAKTPGPLNVHHLDGYRHEFGSIPIAESDVELSKLSVDMRDLALHLIAAHHGFARPTIGTGGGVEPPSALESRATAVALRFVRLQRQWGPWGLAWLESLLRAADQLASRRNDARDESEPSR